jgi:hypothetical protein
MGKSSIDYDGDRINSRENLANFNGPPVPQK